MKYVFFLAITLALLATACVSQSAQAPKPNHTVSPTAVSGAPTSTPTTARTATPVNARSDTLGSYDDIHDLRSFAARLDKAIQEADVEFFLNNVAIEELKCDADFPAPPQSCSGKPKGATVQGIVAGVWASEGFGLDANGYEAFVREFLTSTDVSAPDAYGDPRPRLYAYGILRPEHRGTDVARETVMAFATRINSGSQSAPGPGRTVLMLHVGFSGKSWRIARLTITPTLQQYPSAAALLDPARPEAKDMLEYWQRWEPSSVPVPSRTSVPAGTPTVRPSGDISPTPVATVPPSWKSFSNDQYGFAFRYPESCGVSETGSSFHFGGRIELAVLGSEGLNLADYVNRFLDDRVKNSGWQIESTRAGSLGGRDAVKVDYRFGGPARFGTATFVLGNTDLFIWGLTAGGFTCNEPDSYETVLSSFRLTR